MLNPLKTLNRAKPKDFRKVDKSDSVFPINEAESKLSEAQPLKYKQVCVNIIKLKKKTSQKNKLSGKF